MNRTSPTFLVAAAVVALLVHAGHAQAPQGAPAGGAAQGSPAGGAGAPAGRAGAPGQTGGRGGAPGTPGGRAGAGTPAPAPLMQTPPKPAIANARPVRSCESLASVALPNTTIESATIDPANPGVCRIQAFTTHPPHTDRIRIWVAIPTSNWNGRFMGTGGGGFSGGSATGVNPAVASGFA